MVLSRIYTLRNQLIHGGRDVEQPVNREQLRDCVNLMGKLVPLRACGDSQLQGFGDRYRCLS